jgi:hypothetical protein
MADNTDRRILGTSEEADFPLDAGLWIPQTRSPFKVLDETLHAERNDSKAMHFRVDGWAGQDSLLTEDQYFNNIEALNQDLQPQLLETWFNKTSHYLLGYRFTFTNASTLSIGETNKINDNVDTAQLQWEAGQKALFVNIGSVAMSGSTAGSQSRLIDHLSIGYTSVQGGKVKYLTGSEQSNGEVTCFRIPLSRQFWDFRGFYGAKNTNGFSILGPIWCNHENPYYPPSNLERKIIPEIDTYPEKLKLKLSMYNNNDFKDYQFSRIGGQNFKPSDYLADKGFFCTLSDNTLRTQEPLGNLTFWFPAGDMWVRSLSMALKGPVTGPKIFGAPVDSSDQRTDEQFHDGGEIVGCTVYYCTFKDQGHDTTWCLGLGLQIEYMQQGFAQVRQKRMLHPKLDQALLDQANGKATSVTIPTNISSEVIHPPQEAGRWVVRGFWGENGAITDRLGVIWRKVA